MELTRAAIHNFATHVSKLKPEIKGSGNAVLNRRLQTRPNSTMNTQKYLYRLATGYMTENNVIISPLTDQYGQITGYFPMLISKCNIVDYEGVKYIRYNLGNGQYCAIELDRCGILNQYQYQSELWGESNYCLQPTLNLIHAQNQGIIEGIKNSAAIRFLAKIATTLKPSDLEEERKNFNERNLSKDSNGGVLVFDGKYEDVKAIDSKPIIVNPNQMQQIKENVFTYFGTNETVLQNKFNSDEWNAYYEGKIEPFALQLGLEHTNITFSEREIAFGNEIMFTANRLQYLSNTEKLNTVTQLFDRGFITHNQGLEIFNMPPVEDGNVRYVRKEYDLTDNYTKESENNANSAGTPIQSDEPDTTTEPAGKAI